MVVRIGPLSLANPVMPASGCFGPELGQVTALDRLGALVTKTVFSRARSGNPAHRLTESSDGMLNAVGIPSPGKAGFVHHLLPGYPAPGVPLIVSIGGLAPDEYWTVTEQLDDVPYAALEVNVSCPNLECGGLELGTDPHQVETVISGVVERTRRPVIAKLTPNVTRIDDIARGAEAGGAVALATARDALEFLVAGATAVQDVIGTLDVPSHTSQDARRSRAPGGGTVQRQRAG